MATVADTPLDLSTLERTLKEVDPGVFLVSPRILRRVIKHHRELGTLGLQVPHRQCYVINRTTLLQIVDPDELGAPSAAALPESLLLIARPDPESLASAPASQTLLEYWRHLFHCRIHLALEQDRAEGKLTAPDLLRRIDRIGQTEFDEVRSVLRQEKLLLPPRDDATTYEEFAAFYLELRYFAPALLSCYFPTLTHPEKVDAILAEDVDAAALFAATRPAGAPDPRLTVPASPGSHGEDFEENGGPSLATAVTTPVPDESSARALLERAEKASTRGNVVRAAILRMKAARQTLPERAAEVRAGAREELDRLTTRLQVALSLNEVQAEEWRRALPLLLERAAEGVWPVEARLLYDLQKVCVDHERGIYAVDLVEWARTFGRRPIKRPLPAQQKVLLVKHLRSAARRLQVAQLDEASRRTLLPLLRQAVAENEARLRARFRPALENALEKVGLVPANVPEQVARNKLIEELLDRILEHGHLNLSHLRDALSRNQLKLPDLAGPGDFLLGDPLLRLNRELAVSLDGIYHGGEIYLRGLQRISSLSFGTAVGRFLTRYLALPFGGAFLLLKTVDLLFHEAGLHLHLTHSWSVAVLGLFLLPLLYLAAFRKQVFHGVEVAGSGARAVVIDAPVWVVRQPLVQQIVHSQPVRLFRRHLFMPLLLTVIGANIAWLCQADLPTFLLSSGAVFLVSFVVLNSRLGRDLEESLTDWLLGVGRWISFEFLPGLFRMIMQVSRWFLEGIERLLYTVDEWLRFRSGQSRLTLVVKAVLSFLWFLVTYLVRIYINLLVEPTVNPIKHFPVVTVGHKMMLPLLPTVFFLLQSLAAPLGPVLANAFAGVTLFFIPGIFGFMVWEFKENWKLYRANRPELLKPILIGSHGETMRRLLRPGFHSGTIPKLLGRLRRAERAPGKNARKLRENLLHVEESIRHFVEREFVELLKRSRGWQGLTVTLEEVHLGTNRIHLGLRCPELSAEKLPINFDLRADYLVANVAEVSWLVKLSSDQRQILTAALGGLYKLAGIDLTDEQIKAAFRPNHPRYAIRDEGLVVWPDDTFETTAVYNLDEEPLMPHPAIASLPVLQPAQLLFDRVPIAWQQWVEIWQRDQDGKEPPAEFLEGMRLLPV
jgi:hypothetical protein